MHDRGTPKSKEQALDDQLASFTDQVLSSTTGGQMDMNDLELANLQQTALRVQFALWVDRPNAAVAARIRSHLQSEWKKVWQPSRTNWQWTQLAVGGMFVLFLAAAIFFLAPTTEMLPGTAEGFLPWTPLFIVIGLTFIAALIWIDRRH